MVLRLKMKAAINKTGKDFVINFLEVSYCRLGVASLFAGNYCLGPNGTTEQYSRRC